MNKKPKIKMIKTKGGVTECAVLIKVNGETRQVALNKELQKLVCSRLPHLFDDGIIKVMPGILQTIELNPND